MITLRILSKSIPWFMKYCANTTDKCTYIHTDMSKKYSVVSYFCANASKTVN